MICPIGSLHWSFRRPQTGPGLPPNTPNRTGWFKVISGETGTRFAPRGIATTLIREGPQARRSCRAPAPTASGPDPLRAAMSPALTAIWTGPRDYQARGRLSRLARFPLAAPVHPEEMPRIVARPPRGGAGLLFILPCDTGSKSGNPEHGYPLRMPRMRCKNRGRSSGAKAATLNPSEPWRKVPPNLVGQPPRCPAGEGRRDALQRRPESRAGR